MLTPEQFVTRWQAEVLAKSSLPDDEVLVVAPADTLRNLERLESARRFLTSAGLPAACAPCLTFDELAQGLRRVWEVYSHGQWSDEQKSVLNQFGVIGSDGAGNPICLDERDGRVVLLDHELLYHPNACGGATMFMNSSLAQLAETLLAFHAELPPPQLLERLRHIDPPAVAEGAFWHYEAMRPAELDEPEDVAANPKPWWKFW